MSKKKLLISIIAALILIGAVVLGIYLFRDDSDSASNKSKTEATTTEAVTEAVTEETTADTASVTTEDTDTASDTTAEIDDSQFEDEVNPEAMDDNDSDEISTGTFTSLETTAVREDKFGDILLDITEIDLDYGDSINISASGGWSIEAIPYYPQFFGRKNSTLLSNYYKHILIANVGASFNKNANIQPGETITITLDERGKYKDAYDAYNIGLSLEKMEGQTDEEFCNAREVTKGNIKPGILHRGSSATNEAFNRVELMDEYLRNNDINLVLSLSENDEQLRSHDNLPEHTQEMLDNDQFLALNIGVDFHTPNTMKALGDGLVEMMNHDGPYLIQCSYGRDRTGLLCAVLEALCGASYEEIVDDYMLSFGWLHKIEMDPTSYQYKLFKERIDDELSEAFEVELKQLSEADLEKESRDFLKECGMTDAEIDKLIDTLTK